MAAVLLPVVPENITVHLGTPTSNAENVTVTFAEYIKNVASGEIYPTWPESALEANIYAIISYVMNRIYTEWYPSQGYNFDITSTTAFDQSFSPDREVYENIGEIVDRIFNNYVIRDGNIQPLFTAFCDGARTQCAGLSQWGTVDLANQGYTALQILEYYYGTDISIVENAPVGDETESYPGRPLRVGSAGNDVSILQQELTRIKKNYPALPEITDVAGIYGITTEAAVRSFQQIFSLPVTGEVDKSTWYKIKRYYNGVKNLADLAGEGISLVEASLPYQTVLSPGNAGVEVRIVQYYLSIIAYFNPALEPVPLTNIYDAETASAVERFQQYYGLPVTGTVGENTWEVMDRIYRETVESLPPGYQGNEAKFYPGYVLSYGIRDQAVTDLQTYLAKIGSIFPEIEPIPVTGYFGDRTLETVELFQTLFGLDPSGVVGPPTWYTIAAEYDRLIAAEQPPQ